MQGLTAEVDGGAGRAAPWQAQAFGVVRSTLLSTTMQAELRRLRSDPAMDDVLEVVAAALRHREALLLVLQHGKQQRAVTIFPEQQCCEAPADLLAVAAGATLTQLKLVRAEGPAAQAPARAAHGPTHPRYSPLEPLLWALALHGPRSGLLAEIGGRAAYRLATRPGGELPSASGALQPAMQRLRRESVALRDMARWPGLSVDRASRLLNALYLTNGLIVTRGHPAARAQPANWRRPFGLAR